LPRLLLSFCNSLTSHIKQFSDAELLACLQLVAKIFSHIQSPVTHVASVSTADISRSLDGKVGDQLDTDEKQSISQSGVKVVVESDISVNDHRCLHNLDIIIIIIVIIQIFVVLYITIVARPSLSGPYMCNMPYDYVWI